jgi:hypothetical protein
VYQVNLVLNSLLIEYSSEARKGQDKQIQLILKHIPNCTNHTIYSVLNCFMKFLTKDIALRAQVIPVFEQYLDSWDPELQQRAIEYLILSKLDGEDPNLPNVSEIR